MATDCPGALMEYMGDLNGAEASTPKPTQNTTTNQNEEFIGVVVANSGLNVRSGAGINLFYYRSIN
ncbi:hypothetical protein D3C81_2022480 [compost metagenome]